MTQNNKIIEINITMVMIAFSIENFEEIEIAKCLNKRTGGLTGNNANWFTITVKPLLPRFLRRNYTSYQDLACFVTRCLKLSTLFFFFFC